MAKGRKPFRKLSRGIAAIYTMKYSLFLFCFAALFACKGSAKTPRAATGGNGTGSGPSVTVTPSSQPSVVPADPAIPLEQQLLKRSVELLVRDIDASAKDSVYSCPTVGKEGIKLTYKNVRYLADYLAVGAPLLARVTDATQKSALRAALDKAAVWVRDHHTSMDTSTYNLCYGGEVEAMTNYHAARGLYQYFVATADEASKRYANAMFEQWINGREYRLENGSQGPFLSWWGASAQKAVGPPWSFLPNYMGQILSVGVLRNRLGNSDGLPAWLATAAANTVAMQDVQSSDATCIGVESGTTTPARHTMAYGGWAHARWIDATSDCAQNLGYHRIIMEGFLDLRQLLFETNNCAGALAAFCRDTPNHLAAGLVWLHGLRRDSDGAYAAVAPSSTARAMTDDDFRTGTPTALQVIFEVLAQNTLFGKKRGSVLPPALKASFDGQATVAVDDIRKAALSSAASTLTRGWNVHYFTAAYFALLDAERMPTQ